MSLSNAERARLNYWGASGEKPQVTTARLAAAAQNLANALTKTDDADAHDSAIKLMRDLLREVE